MPGVLPPPQALYVDMPPAYHDYYVIATISTTFTLTLFSLYAFSPCSSVWHTPTLPCIITTNTDLSTCRPVVRRRMRSSFFGIVHIMYIMYYGLRPCIFSCPHLHFQLYILPMFFVDFLTYRHVDLSTGRPTAVDNNDNNSNYKVEH